MLLEIIQQPNNFLEGFSSTLIATLTALFIFLLERRWEKKKDRQITREGHVNNMKYFHALIRGIVDFVREQKNGYHEHIERVLQNPTEYQAVPMVLPEDLYRLLNNNLHSPLFHSFLAIKENNQENVNAFTRLFSNLDYVKRLYEQANDNQKRYQENIHSAKVGYRDLVQDKIMRDSASHLAIMRQALPNAEQDPLYQIINNIFIAYYANRPGHITIQYLQENFVVLLRDRIIENDIHTETTIHLTELCRQATFMYNDIIFQSTTIANDFRAHEQSFAEVEEIIIPYVESLRVEYR